MALPLSLGGAPGGAGPALVQAPRPPVGLPLADAAPGGATPGRGLATRSPVDDVQVVQVIHCVQHLAQHVLQPLGEKETPGWAAGKHPPFTGSSGATQHSLWGHGLFPPCGSRWA